MNEKWLFIHGGWGGAWQWDALVAILKQRNIECYAPTLPGMGNENASHITLDNHIDHLREIMNRIDGKVNICAFSFGGMAATSIGNEFSNKLNKIIYIDAFIPEPGESFVNIIGEKISRQIRIYSETMGDNGVIPPFFETNSKYCNHPLNTIYTKINYNPMKLKKLLPVYIECTKKNPLWSFTPVLENISKKIQKTGWKHIKLESDHMPMFSHAKELMKILITQK